VVAAVERHGLAFISDAARHGRAARCHSPPWQVDTGRGAVLTVAPGGTAVGAITPWSATTEAG